MKEFIKFMIYPLFVCITSFGLAKTIYSPNKFKNYHDCIDAVKASVFVIDDTNLNKLTKTDLKYIIELASINHCSNKFL